MINDEPLGDSDPAPAYVETRQSYFGKIQPARCYDFQRLRAGHRIEGPAIIWTPITTIVVQPGQTAICDGRKNIVMTW
jgi:N-methylhydantoinase A